MPDIPELLTINDLMEVFKCKRGRMFNIRKDPTFPKARWIGRTQYWLAEEVGVFIENSPNIIQKPEMDNETDSTIVEESDEVYYEECD